MKKRRIIQISGGDIRQAQFHLNFPTHKVDGHPHVYKDSWSALSGQVKEDLDFHTANWIAENSHQVDCTLEEYRKLTEELSICDYIETINPEMVETVPVIVQRCRGLAVNQLIGSAHRA